MPQGSARTIKRPRFSQWYVDNRIDKFEKFPIRRFLVEIVSLVANGVTLAALHPVVVVVQHFLKRATINYGLITLETFALFSFKRLNRHGSKFDPPHRAPRLRAPF